MKKRPISQNFGSEISRSNLKRLPSFTGRAGLLGAAVAVPGLQAGTVQINQIDNKAEVVSGNFTNSLDADFTQDENDDATLLTAVFNQGTFDHIKVDLSVSVDPFNYVRVGWSSGNGGLFRIAKPPTQSNNGAPFTRNFLFPVKFTDSRINGGDETNAYMEVKCSHASSSTYAVELVRLVFDDAGTALPSGVSAGGSNTVWQEAVTPPPTVAPPPLVQIDVVIVKKKIKKLRKKIIAARKSRSSAKLKKFKKQLKALKQQL